MSYRSICSGVEAATLTRIHLKFGQFFCRGRAVPGGNNLPLVLNKQFQVASHKANRCKNDAQRKDGEPSARDAADLLEIIKNDVAARTG